jgi:aldehyde:ferredoxin oxidoreductase
MSDIYGWTGTFLWVDLSNGSIRKMDTQPYAHDYIGGRGIEARLAWEFMPAGIGAFDERNLLMVFPGPLTGTTAPFSGRTTLAGHAPQGYPYEWFSRASFGGHFGPTLKYAGYDGLVISGKADKPVYLFIDGDKVELRDAGHLWGKGCIATQKILFDELGSQIRVLTMGQAGENLSRISVVQTETESAAGQGGYGAVMGAKKLKAIVVQGCGAVRVADPDLLFKRGKAIIRETRQGCRLARGEKLDPELVKKYALRYHACTQQCGIECGGWSWYFVDVPGPISGQKVSGHWHCVAPIFPGLPNTYYDWKIGFEAGFELGQIANDYGLNHWDLVFGVLPLVRYWREAGLKPDLDGLQINLDDPLFWNELFRKIAYRQGIGDALAEGGWRAAQKLGLAADLADMLYQGWGYAGHMDARGDRCNKTMYPFWIAPALQWAVDTRDPMASSHGYVAGPLGYSPLAHDGKGPTWEMLMDGAERLYGTRAALDPQSHYEGKAEPAYWHCVRAALKDSLTVDDNVFPMLWSYDTPDGIARADGMEGYAFEYHLFTAATGANMSYDELNRAGDRICNLERALQIRDAGRSRQDDEAFINHFAAHDDFLVNPFVGRPMKGDPEQLRRLLDQFYALRGWDVATGRPTPAMLMRLGLSDVAADLQARGLIP